MQKWMVGIVMVLLMMVLFVGCKEKAALEMDVEIGRDGAVRIGTGNLVRATIHNNGTAFEGELSVLVGKEETKQIIIATPFTLEEGMEKQIDMYIPIYTIQKDVTVAITKNDQSVYQEVVHLERFLSPTHLIIGVITDYPDRYNFLKKVNLIQTQIKEEFAYYNSLLKEEKITDRSVEVLFFNSFDALKKEEDYDYLDYIYLGKTNNSKIDGQTTKDLRQWIKKGHTLMIETGATYKKAMQQLPEELTNVHIKNVEEIYLEKVISERVFEKKVAIATGALVPEFGGQVLEEEGVNYGVISPLGQGHIFTLSMNLGEAPFYNWPETSNLFEDMVTKTRKINNLENTNNYAVSTYGLDRVFMKKELPYMGVIAILVIYIFFVGPFLYFLFKKKDKRDWLWVAIPSSALICLVILYIVGLGTRQTEPIINIISTIKYQEGINQLNVESNIAILNNKQQPMIISWDKEEQITLSNININMYGINLNERKELEGKMVLGSQNSYESYDKTVWHPNYLKGRKMIELTNQIETPMIKVKANEEGFRFEVTNPTPLDLEYVFLIYSDTLYWLGSLKAYETAISEEGKKQEIYQLLGDHGQEYQDEIDITMLEQLYNADYRKDNGYKVDRAMIYGINKDPVGYNIQVNKREIKAYNYNAVKMKAIPQYKQGDQIKILHGMIEPTLLWNKDKGGYVNIYEEQPYGKVLSMESLEACSCNFQLPLTIEYDFLEINLENIYSAQDFMGVQREELTAEPLKNITTSVHNYTTGEEEILERKKEGTNSFILSAKDYIDEKGRVTLTIDARAHKIGWVGIQMRLPTISVGGVVKK